GLIEDGMRRFPDVLGFQSAYAAVLAWGGRTDEAHKQVAACVTGASVMVPQDSGWSTSIALLAEAAAVVGDQRAASRLLPELEPVAHRWAILDGPGVSWGSLAHPAGALARTLGRLDDAIALLEQARTMETSMRTRPWLAR